MPTAPDLSASPLKVFDLFDPEEQADFLRAEGVTRDDLLERFTASDLLTWIVRHRSAFVRMATENARLLTRIEASIRGNIEFIVSAQDGKEVDLAFGPQVRALMLSASTWIDHTAPVLNERLTSVGHDMSQFCGDAQTTEVERDSDEGEQFREMAERIPDPMRRMQLEYAADAMKIFEEEVNPADIQWMSKVRDAAERVERRVAALLEKQASADTTLTVLRRMRHEAEQAHRRIAHGVSHGYPQPKPLLEERRANRIIRGLDEIESLARQAKRLDEAGTEVMEAMGLSIWKERWRIYELWVLCFICLKLAARSDNIDPLDRIRDGRWILKFTRDAKPVLACGFDGRWIDVFYQYFEPGEDRANMPDIAVRERATGAWLAIVDPKMGESYRQRDMAEVCLRYAEAFQAGASIIASYFPDEPSLDQLADAPGAMICNGLRPGSTRGLSAALSAACQAIGISLATKTVVILADVSGSTADCRDDIASAIQHAVKSDPDVDRSVSIVASFNDQWVEQASVETFLTAPNLSQAGGATDCNGAVRKAAEFLSSGLGAKEIWLFSDGEGLSVEPDELNPRDILLNAYITSGGLSENITALCKATGGKAFDLGRLPTS